MNYYLQKYESPIGLLYMIADSKSLLLLTFEMLWSRYEGMYLDCAEQENSILKKAKQQLDEYFLGERKFFDIPLDLGGTKFQTDVWSALSKIPYGQTRTYKEQAEMIKSPRAVRAVGRTNGLNPICVILPCHRVVGSNGNLTGYAGGLGVKKFLLDFEAHSIAN